MNIDIPKIPLEESDRALLKSLEANPGFLLLLKCIEARREFESATGARIIVDNAGPIGRQEADEHFDRAILANNTLNLLNELFNDPQTYKSIKL